MEIVERPSLGASCRDEARAHLALGHVFVDRRLLNGGSLHQGLGVYQRKRPMHIVYRCNISSTHSVPHTLVPTVSLGQAIGKYRGDSDAIVVLSVRSIDNIHAFHV